MQDVAANLLNRRKKWVEKKRTWRWAVVQIFQDLSETEYIIGKEEESEVFQNFGFDDFEQELLKDHSPQEVSKSVEETSERISDPKRPTVDTIKYDLS